MKKKRLKTGFSLLEMMLAIAIVVTLCAFGFVSVIDHQKNLAVMEADETAKEIFLAAQEHLSMAALQGRLSKPRNNSDLLGFRIAGVDDANFLGAPVKKDGSDDTGTYAVFNDMSAYADPTPAVEPLAAGGEAVKSVAEVILPRGAVDDYVLNHRYAVRYNANAYKVLEVFYTTEQYRFNDQWEDLDTWDEGRGKVQTNPRSFHIDGDSQKSVIMGWYGEEALFFDENGALDFEKPTSQGAPQLVVVNGPILYALVTVSNQYDYSDLTMNIEGVDGGSAKINLKDDNTNRVHEVINTGDTTTYLVILDDVTDESMTFANLPFEMTDEIQPGSDIRVSVSATGHQVSDENGNPIEENPADLTYNSNVETRNSLFADDSIMSQDTVDNDEAHIRNFRHLQNLSKLEDQRKPVVATLEQDIIWDSSNHSETTFTGAVNAIRHSYAPSAPDPVYNPVKCDYELTFNGNGNAIKNLKIEKTDGENAGVFGTLNGVSKIEKVNLENTTVVTAEAIAAGALVGYGNSLTINEVTSSCDPSVSDGSITAKSSAGGLVGSAKGVVNISRSQASFSGEVKAGDFAGGLIGSADGTVTVSHSASYSPDLAVNSGEDGHTAKVTATGDNGTSGVAGGLIGALVDRTGRGAIVTGCAAANKVTAGNPSSADSIAGGLIGATSGPVSVDLSYVGGYTNDPTPNVQGGYSGGLVGRARSEKMTLTNVYSTASVDGKTGEDELYTIDGATVERKGDVYGIDSIQPYNAPSAGGKPYNGDLLDPNGNTRYPYKSVKDMGESGDQEWIKNHIGDWPSRLLETPTLKLHNEEVLYAEVSLEDYKYTSVDLELTGINGASGSATIHFDLNADGTVKQSERVYPKTNPDGSIAKDADGKLIYIVVLDDVTVSGMKFGEIDGNTIPMGADMEGVVKAKVEGHGQTIDSNIDRCNSLFAEGSDPDTPHVDNFRHLQNLSELTDIATPVNATLDKSLDWENAFKNVEDVRKLYTNDAPSYTPVNAGYELNFGGNGKTISNLTIDKTDNNKNAGVFGAMNGGGSVKDLTLKNITVNAPDATEAGSLIGHSEKTLTVTGVQSSSPSVTASECAGGLIGHVSGKVTVTASASYSFDTATPGKDGNPGRVTATDGNGVAGGLIGKIGGLDSDTHSTIEGCAASNIVNADTAGGLIGNADGPVDVSLSYVGGVDSAGDSVQGGSHAGGLIGHVDDGGGVTLSNVYSSASVDGPDTGALYPPDASKNVTVDGNSYGVSKDMPESSGPSPAKPYNSGLLDGDSPDDTVYPYVSIPDMIGSLPPDEVPGWWKDNPPEWMTSHVGDWPVDTRITFRYLFAYDDDGEIREQGQDVNSRAPAWDGVSNFFAAVRNYVSVTFPIFSSDVKPVSWDWVNYSSDVAEVSGRQYVSVTEDPAATGCGEITEGEILTFPKVDLSTFNRQNFYLEYWSWEFLWNGNEYEARYYPKYANGDLGNGNLLVYMGEVDNQETFISSQTDGKPWPQNVPLEDENGVITLAVSEKTDLLRYDAAGTDNGTALFKAHGQQEKSTFQLQAWAVRATLDDEGNVIPGTMSYLGLIPTKLDTVSEDGPHKVFKLVLAEHSTVLSGCDFSGNWYADRELTRLLSSTSQSDGQTTYSRITDVPLEAQTTNIYAMYTQVNTRTIYVNFNVNGAAYKTYSYVYKAGDAVDIEFHVPVVEAYTPTTWGLKGASETQSVPSTQRLRIQIPKGELTDDRTYEVTYESERTTKLRVIHLIDWAKADEVGSIARNGSGKGSLTVAYGGSAAYRVIVEEIGVEPSAGQINKEKYALNIGSNGDSGYLSETYDVESNNVYNPDSDEQLFVKNGNSWTLNTKYYWNGSSDDKRAIPVNCNPSNDADDNEITYTQVIVYNRKAYRLNIDLNKGKLKTKLSDAKITSESALPALKVYAGQDTPTASYLDSGNAQYLDRDQYAPQGYYFLSREEYLSMSATDLEAIRTYSAANSSKYKASEKLPAENRVAVAIWKLVDNPTATIRVDIYIQKKTDPIRAADSVKSYDLTYTGIRTGMPVNADYNNAQLAAGINEVVGELRTALNTPSNPLYQAVNLTETFTRQRQVQQGWRWVTVEVFNGYFQRNQNLSGILNGPTTIPGTYNNEGENVIRIYYDRATIRFTFGGANGSTSTDPAYRLLKSGSEWKFVTGNSGERYVEGLYQAPLKNASGELFTWPTTPRLKSPNGTQLTFLTYYSPPQDPPLWEGSGNNFTYLYDFQGYTTPSGNTLTFYKEELGHRKTTDSVPQYDSSTYIQNYFNAAQSVVINGTFTLTDKFDGFNVFAYRQGPYSTLLDGKPNGVFRSGISFNNGGRIYARRITYTIDYTNAIDMLTAQPSSENRNDAQNYYNYPLKRLYEEELEQLPRLTNANYPEGDDDYTFAGWSTVLDFYDKEAYVTDGTGQFVTYSDGQFVPDGLTHTMPSNGLNYIAMWSAEKRVKLMVPQSGTANSKSVVWEELLDTPIVVQKYTALAGNHNGYTFHTDGHITRKVYDGHGNEVSGQTVDVANGFRDRFTLPEGVALEDLVIKWYLDPECKIEFDPERDQVIEDNMPLYANLIPEQRVQEYYVYYVSSMTDSNGDTIHISAPIIRHGVVGQSTLDRPSPESFRMDDGSLYVLSSSATGINGGETLTQVMVDNGVTYVYNKTETEPWSYTAYNWLKLGDSNVYLRLGKTEYNNIMDRRVILFPDELRGFQLLESYRSILVEPDADDGEHSVTGKHKTVNVLYKLDSNQLSFLGGSFQTASLGSSPVRDGSKVTIYRPEAMGVIVNGDESLSMLLLDEYLKLDKHLQVTYDSDGESATIRNNWQDGGWKWLWARSDDGNSFGELSDTAYALYVDYVYTGADTRTHTVSYPMSGDTDSALTVSRSESGSLPATAGRYGVTAELYAQIPGDSSTRATLYTFPAVNVDLLP